MIDEQIRAWTRADIFGPMPQGRLSIDERLELTRTRIQRLSPAQAAQALTTGAVLVDTRDSGERAAEGVVPGSVWVTRNTLEWRADPSAEVTDPVLCDFSNTLVIMCNDGYASSFAVESLVALGHTKTCDLIGGYRAWKAQGLPTQNLQSKSVLSGSPT